MKTLSVRQPWAYLLCAGIKNIENRTWKLPGKYKGEWVLIHASAKVDKRYTLTEKQRSFTSLGRTGIKMRIYRERYRSAIIGAVKFSDCVINHESIWAEKTEISTEWGKDLEIIVDDKPIYNWVTTDAILFNKPILNVKGRLGFWDFDLPEEYVELLK